MPWGRGQGGGGGVGLDQDSGRRPLHARVGDGARGRWAVGWASAQSARSGFFLINSAEPKKSSRKINKNLKMPK